MSTTSNNPLILVAVLGIFAVVIILVIVFAIKRREEVFEGEVTDKNIQETNRMPMNNMGPMNNGGINIMSGGGIQHDYYIYVKTDVGKSIKYKISSGMYEIIKIGDRVRKPKGTTEVTIVSSNTANTTAPNPAQTENQQIPPTNPNPPSALSQ